MFELFLVLSAAVLVLVLVLECSGGTAEWTFDPWQGGWLASDAIEYRCAEYEYEYEGKTADAAEFCLFEFFFVLSAAVLVLVLVLECSGGTVERTVHPWQGGLVASDAIEYRCAEYEYEYEGKKADGRVSLVRALPRTQRSGTRTHARTRM